MTVSRWRRTRAVLSLGLVLGLGSVSTMAFWTDTATMDSGQISSGTLDLQISGNLEGQGGSWNNTALSMSSMVPGESMAITVPVQREADSVGFDYGATATASGGLASHLRWTVTAGTAGTPQTGPHGLRTNTCSGTVLGANNATLSGTAAAVIAANSRTLAGANYSENICIRVELPASASNAAQSQSATASFVFDAQQVS